MQVLRARIAVVLVLAGMVVALTVTAVDAQNHGPTHYQTANIVDFASGLPVGGGATLFRTNNAAWVRIGTTGLDPGAVYTVWWIVWNNPRACSDPCGEDDLGIAGNSVFYATGFVAGSDGIANATGHMDSGHSADGIDVLIPGGLWPGRGLRAEIHLVIRTHGVPIPGSVDAQMGSFDGGCGVNLCADQQAVVFPPVR